MRPLGAGLGNKKIIKKISMVSNCTRCQIVRFYTWCQIVRGVKLSWCQIVRCQIVLVSNCPVSNCPRCQIVRCQIVLVSNCPPTWAVSNCPRCQIVLVSNCPGTYGKCPETGKRQNPLNSAKTCLTQGTDRPFRCLD